MDDDERGMDPKFIKASEEGNAEYLDIHVERALSSYRTIVGDSVLHLHVREKGRKCDNRFMAAIIAKDPSLVYARNDAEENPFHTAAKSGQDGAVKFLIENGGASYMIMVNKDGDTALHIACREGNLDVVKELLVCRSAAAAEAGVVPAADYKYGANNAGETPLHLAVEKNCHEIVHLLMENISTSQHGHPTIGCALHSAVSLKHLEFVVEITRKLPSLIRFEDCKGQTPLHYAAFKSWPEGLEVLLKKDPLAVYCRDRNGRTAAHIAAQCNDVRGVQLFAGLRQDCCEVLDNNGQNVAHCAAEWGSGDVFRYLLDSSQFVHLMYQKDIHGNTPLHLFAESIPGLSFESLSSMRRNDVISLLQKRMKPVFNNENCTPGDIAAKHMDTISELEPSNQVILKYEE